MQAFCPSSPEKQVQVRARLTQHVYQSARAKCSSQTEWGPLFRYSFRKNAGEGSMTTPFELVDLSHTVEHGMITYKGLPAPVISDHMSREDSRKNYAPGTQFHIGKIEMVANTGTYLDSPFHRYDNGKDLSQLELSSLVDLDGVVAKYLDRAERGIRA